MSDPSPIALPPTQEFAFPFRIASLKYDLALAKHHFGESPWQNFVDGLGDADYWAFEYPCGLRMLFEFIHPLGVGMVGYANVFADLPETEHGLRHLTFPKSLVTPAAPESNAHEIETLSTREPWSTLLATLHGFQVWRQGDDGNQMPVGEPTTERDARCRVKELESHGHKQIYWYTSTSQNP